MGFEVRCPPKCEMSVKICLCLDTNKVDLLLDVWLFSRT